MKNLFAGLFLIVLAPVIMGQDEEATKDYYIFPRIKGFELIDNSVIDFGGYRFCDESGETFEVQGMVSYYYYETDGTVKPSMIIDTFSKIVTGFGGKVYGEDPNQKWMTLKKDNKMIWVDLFAEDFYYTLNIVEKGEIMTEITAEELISQLNSSGSATLYLNFDRDQCIIKEECKPVIEMIARVLNNDPAAQYRIESFTDDVGRSDDNLLLSTNRAKSFIAALSERGVDEARLEPVGFGEDKPVADNQTVEGRALNNRIVIVKK